MACLPETLLPAYAELHCLSNFSFQRGASHPEELVARAAALGYAALAITDECSVAGLVRAHTEAKKLGLKLLPGAEFVLAGTGSAAGFTVIALPRDLPGWGDLCEFITLARCSAPKGRYHVSWQDAPWAMLGGCEVLLAFPSVVNFETACAIAIRSRSLFASHLWLSVELLLGLDDALWLHKLQQVSRLSGVPLVASGNVHMHLRSRKPLQDVMTAVRLGQPVSECGFALQPNAEAHLRSRQRLAAIYPPELLANTLLVAQRCHFSLDQLRYQYPLETMLPGLTAAQTLRQFTLEGAVKRYPQGLGSTVQQQIEHELALISELKYEMYFLTVHDIVAFARSRDILCQGRGSAANSAVCYCLGITEVDPSRTAMLFERFISRERNEPPDIDVDFEHDRREEVIQYIYAKYGRERAALTAVVVSYRPRSALRDVGRALAIDEALITALAKEHPGMYSREVLAERLQSALEHLGPRYVPPPESQLQRWLQLSTQLQRFPRHLSQHVGGFVLTQGKLTRLVPVENAAMPERSIVQWDKDDLDAMGLLKVDVLALGMLSAIRRCLDLISAQRGSRFRMQDIPAEDTATYDMICKADTVGVFQIESRAQMSMLPRLKPRCYYDLVIEVAIVRPGPIQGGMVHPYLKAREHRDQVVYPSPALEEALKRTLGVPIFQEQVMQIAMLAAGFSAGESDSLRRSMAAWKRKGGVHHFYERMVGGMVARGYAQEFADNIFKQIEGFGEYGFPESHAASFALLVYVSCWLKQHEPACYLVAMLNSQPMGFYGPAQLVQDAQRHGVQVRAVDVRHSDWDCTLEASAVRLGLRLVSGLAEVAAQRIVAARTVAAFTSTEDLALRAELDQGDLRALASADALISLSGHRRQQVWQAAALKPAPGLLRAVPVAEDALVLPAASEGEEVVFDYAAVGFTLRSHPMSLLRAQLAKEKLLTAAQLRDLPSGRLVRACGIVIMRQQPQTAKGVVFVTLEDETGSVNVIVWKSLRDRQRTELMRSRLMAVYGVWQRDEESGGEVRHLIAKRLKDLTPLLGGLTTVSREFH
ncbi:MAG: error-prone DNA polymerase [Rhodoferax sp.]|uniref:error-prone DNA polymerase n=1 Tax=Rhodoferax sp. TaxID=50421 RepID=UPI002614B1CE|nr:error-prone DNA polymerase [Rhodoferax sp.]MDD5333681.1 error-prone DNA polymerase [Rhodoferax sp.]